MGSPAGFVPPPYPHDRLVELWERADAQPGGVIDCSVGTPVDPVPDPVRRAIAEAASEAAGYPPSVGTPAFRNAAVAWMARRFGVDVSPSDVIAGVGTKEVVASLPRLLSLRDPTRDTVLSPAIAYPTYAMGARLAGLRAVPVPVDNGWRPDLRQVTSDDLQRAVLLWLNEPANPTGSALAAPELTETISRARTHGVVVASDECYAEFTYDENGEPASPTTALAAGTEGVLAVHSLSKRSNMAGLRAGFVAGDPELVRYLGEVRRHAGLMMPSPVQAAAAAALADDEHVAEQRARYASRRKLAIDALTEWGVVHDGGPSTFYLWLRAHEDGPHRRCDGWGLADRFGRAGILVAPGDLYGETAARHVRLALTQPDERLALGFGRLREAR